MVYLIECHGIKLHRIFGRCYKKRAFTSSFATRIIPRNVHTPWIEVSPSISRLKGCSAGDKTRIIAWGRRYAITTDLVSLRERGKWFGLITMTWAVGTVLGPVVGGALAQPSSWVLGGGLN